MIAENGQMAIHIPLSAARVGAFSTHTAHPRFVAEMEGILSTVLCFPINVVNPYLYMTKAEAVARVVREHSNAVPLTVSCWQTARLAGEKKHCGQCVPCLVRRIALEHNGLRLDEYRRELFGEDISTLSADDGGKRNLNDLGEFIGRFGQPASDTDLFQHYPELADAHFDTDAAISMYRRFAAEAVAVLRRYPRLECVIS